MWIGNHANEIRMRTCRPFAKWNGFAAAAVRAVAWVVLAVLSGQVMEVEVQAELRWPRFRGPAGNGQSADGHVPVKWGPGDVAWRTVLDGQGHSSPCVWEDKIFLASARKKEGGQIERSVVCLDRRDGKVVWQKSAWSGKAEANHSMNGYASSTCATDGQRVVAFLGHGGIHCFDYQGKLLWTRNLGDFPGTWGTAASPIILGQKVIQNCDAEGESSLVALDKDTGQTIWKTSRGKMPRGGWSTPILIDTGARKELVLNGEYGIHGYDPETGRELWFCKGFNGRGTPAPVFGQDRLFVISSKPGDTFAVRPGGKGDVTETHMIWHTPRRSGRNLASPILVGNYLLTVAMEGNAYGYDALSGKELWSERLRGKFTASPIAAGGLVYFLSEGGETLVVKPGDKLDVIERNLIGLIDEGEIFRGGLVPCDGQMLIRSDRALYCVGKNAAN